MNFKDRKLAITDVETTGFMPAVNEIIEIGLVVCSPELEILDTLNIKIKPEHLENVDPGAFGRNGYKKENWVNSVSLKEAMEIYSEKTKDAVFCAYNATFDWSFILEAFRQTGVKDKMDYHRIDILSMVFQKFNKNMENVTLDATSRLFNIQEELMPHNALNGAMQALEVLKKL